MFRYLQIFLHIHPSVQLVLMNIIFLFSHCQILLLGVCFYCAIQIFFLVEILVHRIRTDSGGSMVDILRWWLLVGTLVPSFLHLHFDHFGGDAFFQVAAVIIVAVAIIISSSCSCSVGCRGAFEHFLTCLNISQSMRNNKFCDICSFSLKIQNTQTKNAMQCEAK